MQQVESTVDKRYDRLYGAYLSLQLSHRRPPETCGLRTRPPTDIDPLRFLDRTAYHRGGISSRCSRGAIPCYVHEPCTTGARSKAATAGRDSSGRNSTTVVVTARHRHSQKNRRSQTAPTLVQSFE